LVTLNLEKDFLEFSKCLAQHEVRFLLIGGYAVAYHGHARATGDIDFWIASGAENEARAIAAIREFAFPSVADDLLREDDAMLRFGVPPYRIEVLKRIGGIEFEEAWPNRVEWAVDGIVVPIIGLGDLRKNKAAVGRDKDRDDLRNLPQK
jgi:predicted nucleotidyltransferase